MRIQKVIKYIMDKKERFYFLARHGFYDKVPDDVYLKKLFFYRLGYELNLEDPRTFNEKIQWLKLYNRREEYTAMADKHAVKEIIGNMIGKEYIVPTLGVWKNFYDIDFEVLPTQFVLKCTHDSGGIVICRNKKQFNKQEAKKKIEKSLNRNYFYNVREWPYKNIEPQIICEQYLEDAQNEHLPVYKVLCFSGKPELIQVIQDDKTPNETIDYYDTQWKKQNLKQNFPNSEVEIARPENLEEILRLASIISRGHPLLRVDFYSVNGKVYFSECTFYSDGGVAPFTPQSWDRFLGDLIVLPRLPSQN